jgi:hypothetical protein
VCDKYSNILEYLNISGRIYSFVQILDFKATNIFGHSFVELLEILLSKYSNIFEISNISGQIYSFVHIFVGC